ncbi:hypothetical protein STEG23_013437, partial [Scotinomys teguina]
MYGLVEKHYAYLPSAMIPNTMNIDSPSETVSSNKIFLHDNKKSIDICKHGMKKTLCKNCNSEEVR